MCNSERSGESVSLRAGSREDEGRNDARGLDAHARVAVLLLELSK